jgi:hypothetical protein
MSQHCMKETTNYMIQSLPHTNRQITEEDDCKDALDCLNQSNEPNDLVPVKFATNKTVKYFVGLIQELGPDNYKI